MSLVIFSKSTNSLWEILEIAKIPKMKFIPFSNKMFFHLAITTFHLEVVLLRCETRTSPVWLNDTLFLIWNFIQSFNLFCFIIVVVQLAGFKKFP